MSYPPSLIAPAMSSHFQSIFLLTLLSLCHLTPSAVSPSSPPSPHLTALAAPLGRVLQRALQGEWSATQILQPSFVSQITVSLIICQIAALLGFCFLQREENILG